MNKDKNQKFQSRAQLIALKIHTVWVKVENVILFPFHWVSEQMGQTYLFNQVKVAERPSLRIVK